MSIGAVDIFMIDHMVVKLGKYLRIMGFDAKWNLQLRTHELISRANAEGRIFLTRNTHLKERYPRVDRVIVVHSEQPVQQLREVLRKTGLETHDRMFSRCIRCNVELARIPSKDEIRDRVHPNVYQRYDTFFRCPSCDTVFWKGSHVKNTCRKLGVVQR